MAPPDQRIRVSLSKAALHLTAKGHAIVRTAMAATNALHPAGWGEPDRSQRLPRDDSGRHAKAPSIRPPKPHAARWPRPYNRSMSANTGIACQAEKRGSVDRPGSGHARKAAKHQRHFCKWGGRADEFSFSCLRSCAPFSANTNAQPFICLACVAYMHSPSSAYRP